MLLKTTRLIAVILLSCSISGLHANNKSSPDTQTQLYEAMFALQPNIEDHFAKKLARSMTKYSERYQMDPWLSLAIAMKESSLKNKHRKNKTIVIKKTCRQKSSANDKPGKQVCRERAEVVRGYSDLSLFQFHVNTLLAMGLDPLRIHQDLDYTVDAHFKILKRKMQQCKSLRKESWSCYHSRTKILREAYVKKVKTHYKGKDKIENSAFDKLMIATKN